MHDLATVMVVAMFFVAAPLDCRQGIPPAPVYQVRVNEHVLFVEVARTTQQRRVGLSQRKRLRPDGGMLFILPRKDRPSFWMKDTYVPLDIAFLADDGAILQIEQMIPLSTDPITSKHRIRYALEVSGRYFADHGVHVGDRIVFPPEIKALKGL